VAEDVMPPRDVDRRSCEFAAEIGTAGPRGYLAPACRFENQLPDAAVAALSHHWPSYQELSQIKMVSAALVADWQPRLAVALAADRLDNPVLRLRNRSDFVPSAGHRNGERRAAVALVADSGEAVIMHTLLTPEEEEHAPVAWRTARRNVSKPGATVCAAALSRH
jgi:hypothetical protein